MMIGEHAMRSGWMIAAALGCITTPLLSQRETTIRDRDRCTECRVEVRPTVQLGAEQGIGIIEHAEARVTRDRAGKHYVVGPYATQVKVFGPSGAFERTIGTKGAGPGEYEGIARAWVTPNDSLLIFDNMLSRYNVVTLTGRFVRSATLDVPPEMQTIVLHSGEFVFSVPIHTPSRIGQPLHRLLPSGTVKNSFGSTDGIYRPDVPMLDRRAITPVGGSVLWSAYHNQYVLEMLNATDGTSLWQVNRDAQWFPSRMRPARGGRDEVQAPEPMIMDVRQDGHGFLMALIAVADPDWRKAVDQPVSGGHIEVSDDHAYYDTVLEVLNPGLGVIVGSHRFSEYVTHFVDDTTVATVVESSKGVPVVQLWDVSINRR